MRLSVASVAGDAGGAEAIAPALELLARRGALAEVWAGPPAAAVFSRAGIAHRALGGSDDGLDLLAAATPTVLLTGTSWGEEPIELRFLDAARRLGIPTVSVIDFWSNYVTRFLSKSGRLVLPDRIVVPDEVALLEAEAEGLPRGRLLITGNPHYEQLIKRYQGFDMDARLAFRDRVGLEREATVVLFASQPIRALYGEQLGYTEDAVLPLVADGLVRVSQWLGHPLVLAIRPHPREGAGPTVEATPEVSVVAAHDEDPLAWALAADLVVGMNSALLLQAAMLGARVVSVQPGLVGVDRLPSNRLGLSECVFVAGDVSAALYRALAVPERRRATRALIRLRHAAAGSAVRLLDVIVSLGTRVISEAV